jgi:hypothetical protein
MKTQNNITRKASKGILTAAIFVAALASVKAGNGMITATDRLEAVSLGIEASIRFTAPAVSAAAEWRAFEYETAVERLENLANAAEAKIRFEAPAIDNAAEVAAYEVEVAVERLEKVAAGIEQTIQYMPAGI